MARGIPGNINELHHRTDLKAIVLGLNHPRSVAVVQSLGRAGIPVVGVDRSSTAAGFSSRYLCAKLLVEDPEKVLPFLDARGRDGGGMLIPTSDDYLILVSQNLGQLSEHFVVTTPPWETLGALMDISRCYEMARELGIRAPRCFKPENQEEMREIVARLDLDHHDYVLKTMPGSLPADARTGRFTKVAGADRETIERECLDIFFRMGQFPAISEVVPGTADRCIGVSLVVDRQHEPVLSYAIRRLKLNTYSRGGRFVHPYEMGANVYCESVHDEEAVDAASRLVRAARYCGPITVEFRRDPADESLVLIKADPRFVRATSLSTKLGLDMPTVLYRVFSGGQVPRCGSYPDGVGWIWLTAYLTSLWKNRSHGSIRRELVSLARSLLSIKAVAFLDLRDPGPFLLSLRKLWRSRVQRPIKRTLGRAVGRSSAAAAAAERPTR